MPSNTSSPSARHQQDSRKREEAMLLAVSQAIGTVRDQRNLLKTIFSLLRPVVEFNDLGLVLDPDGQQAEDCAVAWPEVYASLINERMHEQQQARMLFPGTLLEHVY